MKKNILLIPSLVLCSFIVSPLLGMERPEYHPIATNPTEENILVTHPDLTHILEDLPEPHASAQEGQSNAEKQADIMLRSVVSPKEEKAIGTREYVRSIFFNNVRNIIAYLCDKTFDVENRRHSDMLNTAVQQAVENDDVSSLMTIMALCRSTDLYKTKIRIDDNDAAQSAYKLLTSDANTAKYDLNVRLASKKIEEADQNYTLEYNKKTETFNNALVQLITTHRQDIATLSDNFDTLQKRTIEQAHAPMVNLAALNQSIRDDANNFVSAHPITKKGEELTNNTSLTTTRLNRLDRITMPKIEILSLTDK